MGKTYTHHVGEAVYELRRKASMTQVDLSLLLGVEQSAVSKLELGRVEWTVEQIRVVAEKCGTKPSRLLARAEELAASERVRVDGG